MKMKAAFVASLGHLSKMPHFDAFDAGAITAALSGPVGSIRAPQAVAARQWIWKQVAR
ncbi:hypothetical protein JHW45_08350 [Paracoccus stylophorae]|uniref:Uncharacterized protein n=1 Tax=Paracoccus stylophorae TaxID=659350 RepID=A0ABY7SYZ7_9RHOB|nr:hypothetical protein [Paracoccus stylophorae]WCR12305.1 hypothetical protein JHW45_08350 [Paracoccus stylophorae]